MSRSAILVGVDMAPFAGVTLFSCNGTDVDAPALATLHDGGHYPDMVALLNGWATYRTLSSTLDAQWSGSGSLSCGIDEDGYFYVQGTGVTGAFTCVPGVSDPWGWGGSVASVSTGAGERATATQPWTRGTFDITTDAQFVINGILGVTETVPASGQVVVQSLPHLLTDAGSGDADGVVETLEKWHNAAVDSGTKRIKWGIDSEGRVFYSRPSGLGSGYAIAWEGTTLGAAFRRMLGFDGTETEVTANGHTTLTGTYPARGVGIIRRGLATIDPATVGDAASVRLMSGRVAGRQLSTWREWDISFALRGAFGNTEASARYADEVGVWRYVVLPYLYSGCRVTVCPEWGDPRLDMPEIAQFVAGATSPVAGSALYRSEVGGVMGRKRCELGADADQRYALRFAPDGARSWVDPVALRLVALD